ncbi:MAG: tetratricopeptide repeat protein [Bacteroidota bacterium]
MSEFTYINDGEQGQFPSLDQLNRYLNGEMSEAERVELESRMVDDPLFADVMEGLSQVNDASGMNQAITRIKTQSRTRLLDKSKKRQLNSKRKSRVQPRTYTQLSLSIAAGISLLLVSVWLVRELIQFKQTSHAERITTSTMVEEEAPIASAESLRDTEGETETTTFQQPATPETNPASDFSNPVPVEGADNIPAFEVPFSATETNKDQSQFLEPIQNEQGGASGPDIATRKVLETQQEDNEIVNSPVVTQTSPPPVIPAPLEREVAPAESPADIVADEDDFLDSNTANTVAGMADSVTGKNNEQPYLSKEELAQIPEHQVDDKEFSNSVVLQEKMGRSNRSRRQESKIDRMKTSKERDTKYEQVPKMTEEERIKAKRARAALIADLLEEASTLQAEGQYEDARLKIQEVLDSSPDNESAMYMMGLNYTADKQPSKAVPYYKLILNNLDSKIYHDAKWELAQVYLTLGRSRAAKKHLQSLGESTNLHQEKAQVQLDSLKNQ